MKIYKADGDTQVVLMKNIDDPEDAIDPTETNWVKAEEATNDSKPEVLNLLKEVYAMMISIRGAYKGSIGSIRNTYMAQLSVKSIDSITVKIHEYIKRK